MFAVILLVLGIVSSSLVSVWKYKNKNKKGIIVTNRSNVSCHRITEAIALLQKHDNQQEEKRLVLLFCWMYAKRKDIYKYADIWLQKGFDVLVLRVTPWKCLWPIIGVQAVATDLLKFLDSNRSYSKIIVHGMSIGGYTWSETMVKMAKNVKEYQYILDKVVGQVWDSIAYPERIPDDLPVAVFPNNKILAKAMKQYLLFHLNTFYEWSSKQHTGGLRAFEQNLVLAPALMFLSDTDTIGRVSNNLRTKECWEKLGIKVHLKIFKDSPHVGHLRKYPEEYREQLDRFLDSVNLNEETQNQENVECINKSHLDSNL